MKRKCRIKGIPVPSVISILFLLSLSTLYAGQIVWNAGAGDWNTAGNWNPVRVPNGEDTVLIDNGDNVTLNGGARGVCKRLEINNTGSLTLGGGVDLDIGIGGIDLDGTLTVTSTTSEIFIAGSLTGSATFNHGNSTVTFDSSGNFTIDESVIFYRLVINKDNVTDTLSSSGANTVTIDDSICISTGTVVHSPNDLTLAGSGVGLDRFTMYSGSRLVIIGTGTFPAGFEAIDLDPASTVEYYSNSNQTIAHQEADGGVLTYGNLTMVRVSGNDRVKTAGGGAGYRWLADHRLRGAA